MPMLAKVEWLKERKIKLGLDFEIQVDGGINMQNITSFAKCGAENLVIGSALFKPGETKINIGKLRKLLADG